MDMVYQIYSRIQFLGLGSIVLMDYETYVRYHSQYVLLVTLLQLNSLVIAGCHKNLGA